MFRWVLTALMASAGALSAQNISPPKPPEPPPTVTPTPAPRTKPNADALKTERPKPAVSKDPKEEIPPEEDTSLVREKIAYNPLEAQNDIKVGNEYFRAGKYRPAVSRFRMATQYDDSNSEAWLRLAEASEKVKDLQSAKEAYSRYLAIAPDGKNVAEIKKKLDKMK